MTALDIIILVVVLAATITGFIKGFVSQLGQVAALVFAIIACRLFAPDVAKWFAGSGEVTTYISAGAYCAVFVVVYISFWLIAKLVRSILHAVSLGIVDRIAGGLFRTFLWTLFLSILLNIALRFDKFNFIDINRSDEHPWRGMVLDLSPMVVGYIEEEI